MSQELFGGGALARVTAWKSNGRKPAEPYKVTARMPLWGIRIGVVTEPERFAGMFIVPHPEDEMRALREGRAPRSRYVLVGSVFHVCRQARHVRATYGDSRLTGETSEMLRARRLARDLPTRALDADRPLPAETLRAIIQFPRAKLAETFSLARRPLKREAAEQVTAIARGTDSRGRCRALPASSPLLEASIGRSVD